MIRKAKKGHITTVDPKKGRVGSHKWKDVQKTAKAKAKKRAANPRKPPEAREETSITRGIYRLFDKYGPSLVSIDMAIEVARAIKPDSKFDKWHLYFHRKIYKQLVADGVDPYAPVGIRPKGEVYIDKQGVQRIDKSTIVRRDKKGKLVKAKATGRKPLPVAKTSGPKTLAEFYALEKANASK